MFWYLFFKEELREEKGWLKGCFVSNLWKTHEHFERGDKKKFVAIVVTVSSAISKDGNFWRHTKFSISTCPQQSCFAFNFFYAINCLFPFFILINHFSLNETWAKSFLNVLKPWFNAFSIRIESHGFHIANPYIFSSLWTIFKSFLFNSNYKRTWENEKHSSKSCVCVAQLIWGNIWVTFGRAIHLMEIFCVSKIR